jgi:sulfur carrier protein
MGATLTVNGSPVPFAGEDLSTLLERLGYGREPAGLAVAVNACVVPRSGWASRRLAAGDAIEIVGAVQGG